MKKLLFALLHRASILRAVSWVNRRAVPILCYHSVVDGDQPLYDPHKQHIPLRLFLQHLDYLQRYYQVVSLNDFQEACRQQRRLPDNTVVLTFDDGFEDFYRVVAPHLIRRKLPATVFVITDRAAGRLPPNGEAFLSWDDIRELALSGMNIGSHTCAHPQLPGLSVPDAIRELAESHAAVIQHSKQSQVALSYPFGRTTEQVRRLAESTGYSCAIAGDFGPNFSNADLYQLSRTVIASDDDVPSFAARVSGLTWWISCLKRMLRAEREKNHAKPLSQTDTAQPRPSLMIDLFFAANIKAFILESVLAHVTLV